jgi:hypothetical protein
MREDGDSPIDETRGSTVRTRPLAALSVAVLSVLVLAGCTGSPDGDGADATAASNGDALCAAAAPSGEVSDSITVGGEDGSVPTAEFEMPLELTSAERTVVTEGDGPKMSDGDYVSYGLTVFDGTTGEQLQSGGYDEPIPAMPITVGGGADVFFGCATEGSRIAVALPPSGETSSLVYVIDVFDVIPAAEWCAPTEPGEGFPTVTFDDNGVPTVTLSGAEPPAEVQIEVVTEGDGDVVESGDTVSVNYQGIKWSDGTTFDSSYDRGEPASFATTGVVAGFQKALEGYKVGSQIAVVIPPACGYGEAESSNGLGGETLVFALEIMGIE